MTVSVCLSICVCVCVFVCPGACVWKYTSDFYQFLCMLPMAMARSSSGGVAISYVLPVLSMTSYLRISQLTQLNVAAQLMEAEPTCSLGLGYKRRVGIPAAGQ